LYYVEGETMLDLDTKLKLEENDEEETLKEDIEREISANKLEGELNTNLEERLDSLKEQFLNEFYKLKFGDSKLADIKRKVMVIYSKLMRMDFNAVEKLYFNLQKEILNSEVSARNSSYEKYNTLRNEFFNTRAKGEKQNKRISVALNMLQNCELRIEDLNKLMEYKEIKEVDSNTKPPELKHIIMSEYENKSKSEINSDITKLTRKAYDLKNYIEAEKLKFMETASNLSSIKKALIIQEALYSKQEKRVREISNSMNFFHDKYINSMFELVVKEAERMSESDKNIKSLVKSLSDPQGGFAEANKSYTSLFKNLLKSLRVSFSSGINLEDANTTRKELEDEVSSLTESISKSKAERKLYFDKLREEFVKRKYTPPSL